MTEELKTKLHSIWDIRHDYLTKLHQIVRDVYDELGGFIAGKDMDGNDIYFLLQYDWVKFSFKKNGYFQHHIDPIELDCFGDLRKVSVEEFRDAFKECDNLLVNKLYEGEKYRDHLFDDLNCAEHLIIDEMFAQLRKENK